MAVRKKAKVAAKKPTRLQQEFATLHIEFAMLADRANTLLGKADQACIQNRRNFVNAQNMINNLVQDRKQVMSLFTKFNEAGQHLDGWSNGAKNQLVALSVEHEDIKDLAAELNIRSQRIIESLRPKATKRSSRGSTKGRRA